MPRTCCASTSRPPMLQAIAVEFARHHRIARGFAFQHLETVGGHKQRARRLVEPVIGAADALDEARGAFGRADADDADPPRPSRCRDRASRCRRPRADRRASSRLRPCGAARARASRDAARWARLSSLSCHSSWNVRSAWLRVLTKTSEVFGRLIASSTSAIAWRARWPAHGT